MDEGQNKSEQDDTVKKCKFNVDLLTDDIEKAVATVRLQQEQFDTLDKKSGPSSSATSPSHDAAASPKILNVKRDKADKKKVNFTILSPFIYHHV